MTTIEEVRIGQHYITPRFLDVEISAVFYYEQDAIRAGYNEPCHMYLVPGYETKYEGWTIVGKNCGVNQMIFAAVRRSE